MNRASKFWREMPRYPRKPRPETVEQMLAAFGPIDPAPGLPEPMDPAALELQQLEQSAAHHLACSQDARFKRSRREWHREQAVDYGHRAAALRARLGGARG